MPPDQVDRQADDQPAGDDADRVAAHTDEKVAEIQAQETQETGASAPPCSPTIGHGPPLDPVASARSANQVFDLHRWFHLEARSRTSTVGKKRDSASIRQGLGARS